MSYKKWLLIAALIVASLIMAERYSRLPDALPPDSVSAALLTPGFYDVGAQPVNLLDKSRFLTTKNGARIARKYVGKLWFPMIENNLVAPGAHPLVIYHPSYGANYSEFSDTANLLAARGYLVLAVTAPINHIGADLADFIADIPEQTQDNRFVLDTLEAWNRSPETLFYARIDFKRIANVGYSSGGIQSLLSSFHPRYRDPRITLTVIAASLTEMFTSDFFAAYPDHRLLAIAADTDRVTPFETNAAALVKKHPQTWLINISGGSHAGFFKRNRLLRWLNSPDILNCHQLQQNMRALVKKDINFSVLGSEAEGIKPQLPNNNCTSEPLQNVNPMEQFRISQLALISFIEMHFADTEFERSTAADFLRATFGQENNAVNLIEPNL